MTAAGTRRTLEIPDLGRLADSLLNSAMERVGSGSGTVWLLDQEQSFRRLCSRGGESRSAPIDPGDVLHRHEEISQGTPFFEHRRGKIVRNSVFLPLIFQDLLIGLVHLEADPSKDRQLTSAELEELKNMGAEAAPAIHSTQVLESIRRNPLRDLESDAYNEPFLLDFLKREIALARRYRRRLGLINLEFEGAESFQKKHSYGVVQAVLRDITETLRGILRDHDVVAHVGSFRFLLGLPDTDRLGCRIAIERMRLAIEQLNYLRERFERFGLEAHFGFSTFPENGDDHELLLMCALEATRANRQDPFHRLDWKELGFWELFEQVIGLKDVRQLSGISDTSFTTVSSSFLYLLQEAITNDISLRPRRRGLVYIGTNNIFVTEALIQKAPAISRVATRISVLGNLSGMQSLQELNINALDIAPDLAESFQFILMLTDTNAYGMMAVQEKGETWSGVHTSHPSLVERLVFKLREEYGLQEQI